MKKSLSLLLALLLCVLALPAGAEEAEPIVITVGMGVNSSEKYAPGESFDNNAWTKLYEERLGIKLDFVLTADSQYSQKLALTIASGDMPDMWRTDKANFALALEGDMLMDLTDLAEEYLSDQAKEELEPFDASFRAATVGGRLMAIPYTGEAAYGASYTFIRHDWLEALGLEEPTNQQEMVDAMIAFQDAESGMFWQVVDKAGVEGNYLETSGSALFAYAVLKGVRLGYLPKRYTAYGEKAFYGTCDRHLGVGADGALQLGGICLVAGLGGATRRDGSLAYYFSEPIVENDAKGVGPLLLAYTEILAAEKQ